MSNAIRGLLVGQQTISHNMKCKCNACSDVSAASGRASGSEKLTTDIHDNWTGLMVYIACDDEVLMLTEHTASRHDVVLPKNNQITGAVFVG